MKRSWNSALWTGFALVLLGPLSYFLVLVRWPSTRDFPWTAYLLVAIGLRFLIVGLHRAWRQPEQYRGKMTGGILGTLSLALAVLFAYGTTYFTRQLPASHGAPQVGAPAPDFTLPDKDGRTFTLSEALKSPFSTTAGTPAPTKALVLIFYRGYW